MSDRFLQLARTGKTQWWHYLLGVLLSIFFFQIVGGLATVTLIRSYVQNDGDPTTRLLSPEEIGANGIPIEGVAPALVYVFFNIAFIFFLLGIYLAIKQIHKRSFVSLITPARRINWKRIGQGFSVFFVLKVIEILCGYALDPSSYTFNFQPAAFFTFLLVVAIFTPIQTATEELFFRGYLLQGIGHRWGKQAGLIITSILFCFVHLLNAEVQTQESWQSLASIVIYFLMIGVFLGWLTLKDNTLELAIGVHAANNIATFLMVTSPNSSIPSPALFSLDKIEGSFSFLFVTAVILLAFSFTIFRLLRSPSLDSAQ